AREIFLDVADSGSGRLLLLLGGRSRRRSTASRSVEHDEGISYRHDVAFAAAQLDDLSGLGRTDGDSRFVSHDFDHFLVFGHLVTNSDEPADDLALGHTFADIRHLEFKLGHVAFRYLSLASPRSMAREENRIGALDEWIIWV